jgi:hypothetical protein
VDDLKCLKDATSYLTPVCEGQTEVISAVKTTLALDRDDPTKADAITALRKQTNDWVAKYRRDASFAGRPSYG